MAGQQLERFAESAVLKLVAPAACTLMLAVGSWGISTIVDWVKRIESAVTLQHGDIQLLQQDVANLKALAQQRGEVLAQQHDAILQLQFDIRMLEQARGAAKP